MSLAIFHVIVATLLSAMAVFGVAIAMAPLTAVPLAAVPVPQSKPPSIQLLDGCVINAIGRLPKADGLRVTTSEYEFHHSIEQPPYEFWTVSVSVDLQGRQATYQWFCRLYARREAELIRKQ